MPVPWMAWDDVIGHDEPKRFLRRGVAGGRVAHALLFAGPRGVGKKTVAEVYGAALLCDDPREGEACGVCANCEQRAQGFHPDLHRLEPDNGVLRIEQVRHLQQRLSLKPYAARRKVALINDAEKMTEQAQNAFLKLLEEPPSGTMITLITYEPGALLPTIRSRCQTVRFSPLPRGDVMAWMQKTGVVSDEATLVAGLSEGSIGEATRLLGHGAVALRDTVVTWIEGLTQPGMEGLQAIIHTGQAIEEQKDTVDDFLTIAALWFKDVALILEGLDELVANKDAYDRLRQHGDAFGIDGTAVALSAVLEAERRLAARAHFRLTVDAMLTAIYKGVHDHDTGRRRSV